MRGDPWTSDSESEVDSCRVSKILFIGELSQVGRGNAGVSLDAQDRWAGALAQSLKQSGSPAFPDRIVAEMEVAQATVRGKQCPGQRSSAPVSYDVAVEIEGVDTVARSLESGCEGGGATVADAVAVQVEASDAGRQGIGKGDSTGGTDLIFSKTQDSQH